MNGRPALVAIIFEGRGGITLLFIIDEQTAHFTHNPFLESTESHSVSENGSARNSFAEEWTARSDFVGIGLSACVLEPRAATLLGAAFVGIGLSAVLGELVVGELVVGWLLLEGLVVGELIVATATIAAAAQRRAAAWRWR